MAIKVQWEANGPYAICDTATEAVELLKAARLNRSDPATAESLKPAAVANKIEAFADGLNDKGRRIFSLTLANAQGIDGEALAKAADIDTSGFGGVLGSISKSAAKIGLRLEDFICAEQRQEGERRYRWFTPGRLLIENRQRFA